MTPGNMSSGHSYMPVIEVNVTSFDREYLHWSFIILEVAAVVVIVIGDISMLMMFFTRKLLGQSTNILVFSVGIGDLVTGILALPLAMMQKILVEPSDFLCKGYFYFANVSKTAVGYTILLLAMERIIALLIHTFRILPPGRCLFFASLTWFFSAAYNIWSVVIYDVEVVTLTSSERRTKNLFLCFASSRFMYLHDIFEVLNPLVTFTFPALCTSLLFVYFIRNKHEADKPGRPYKSSKSVVIFTFALLVSFVASHLPWEIATLVLNHDAPEQYTRQMVSLKILHLMSFSRGFWDIFIFGGFRHYVCKKEKALAHFREQRSLQVQRSSLAIPLTDRPMSTSLLDSDPSVSRRYSSDISRRPSAFEDNHSCLIEQGNGYSHYEDEPVGAVTTEPHVPAVEEIIPVVVTVGYLIPRSPCASDSGRRFIFPPCNEKIIHVDLENTNGMPTKSRFGSCEAIQENPEDGDILSSLGTPAKGNSYQLRRKSCGDKISHSRNVHFRPRTTKSWFVCRGAHASNSRDATLPMSKGCDILDAPEQNNVTKLCSEEQATDSSTDDNISSNNQSSVATKTSQSYQIPISKSAEKLTAPGSDTLQPYNHETRRNTLNVPSPLSRRSSTCKYLTVPSTLAPFIPRSPCASE